MQKNYSTCKARKLDATTVDLFALCLYLVILSSESCSGGVLDGIKQHPSLEKKNGWLVVRLCVTCGKRGTVVDVLWARGLLCPFQKNSINTPLRVNLTGRHEVCALETAHSTRWTVVLHTDGFLRSPPPLLRMRPPK